MSSGPTRGQGRWRRAVPVVVLAAAGSLAVAGPVAAAPRAGTSVAPSVAAGDIATVAGGVGGPGHGTRISLQGSGSFLCGVSSAADGNVYVGNVYALRQLSRAYGQLTARVGTGVAGPLGGQGPAYRAGLDGACQATVDGAGNLVIADQEHQRIRVVAHKTGTFYGQPMIARHIYTVAGDGTRGFSGNGGPATSAKLNNPEDVTVDGAGNLVIADGGNNRVRVVAASSGTFYGQAMTAGDIYTVAGGGKGSSLGNGGPATSAKLSGPESVAVDRAGNLVIADPGHYRVRVVAVSSGTFYGQAMTAGDIYSVAGDGTRGFSGDGGPAIRAALGDPTGVAVDYHGNLVIADYGNNRVRVVAESTGTMYGRAMTAGDIYSVAGDGKIGFSGDGGPATSAELDGPSTVAVDSSGNLLIADDGNERVRVVSVLTGVAYGQALAAGDISTVAGNGLVDFSGDGGPATRAQFYTPQGVAVDSAGNLIISDTPNGVIRVVAATSGRFYQKAMTAKDVYAVAGGGTGLGNGIKATDAQLDYPQGAAVDGAGNLVIADSHASLIRVVAESSGTFYGQAMTAGDIYTVAGGGTSLGDGGPATSASLSNPAGVAVDGAGNLVIADSGENRIRVVAETSGTFYGQAMTAGDIYTVAGDGTGGFSGDGGPGTAAELNQPGDVAVDGAGNLVIADGNSGRIRVLAGSSGTFYGQAMTAGDIYTVAGDGYGFGGAGGPATSAKLAPDDVAVDGAGNIVISDWGNSRIWVVAKSSGTFYGQPMTAGDIYIVAGNDDHGFYGDGGPAINAGIENPSGIAVDQAGNLVFSDTNHDRIRVIGG